MKKSILLITLIYSSIISHSQNKTIDIENGRVIKTKSGYSIFGVINDVFTVTNYDNQLNKITEYKKDVKEIKSNSPFYIKYDDHYDFTFYKKRKGFVCYNLRLDTNLNVIKEEDSYNGINMYVPISEKFHRSISASQKQVAFLAGKEISFDETTKKINIKKKSPGQDENPQVIFSGDLKYNGTIDKYGFETINNKLYFYVKTVTEELYKSRTPDQFLLNGKNLKSYSEINSHEIWNSAIEEIEFDKVVGELYIGEIDVDKNMVKYFTRIPNAENDYSIKKILFDDRLNQLIVTGEFLKLENYKSEKKKDRSDQTGWYITSIDKVGKIHNLKLYNSTDTVFDNIKSRLQDNKSTSIQKIVKTKTGYIILANYYTSFFNNSSDGSNSYSSKVKQPFGFFIYEINENFEIVKQDYYPIKQKDKIFNKIEDISNSNTVKGNNINGEEFYLSVISDDFNNLVYVYKNQIYTIKNRKNISYLRDILTYNFEELPTYFYPLNNEKFYIVNIKPKSIVFELMSY